MGGIYWAHISWWCGKVTTNGITTDENNQIEIFTLTQPDNQEKRKINGPNWGQVFK